MIFNFFSVHDDEFFVFCDWGTNDLTTAVPIRESFQERVQIFLMKWISHVHISTIWILLIHISQLFFSLFYGEIWIFITWKLFAFFFSLSHLVSRFFSFEIWVDFFPLIFFFAYNYLFSYLMCLSVVIVFLIISI